MNQLCDVLRGDVSENTQSEKLLTIGKASLFM